MILEILTTIVGTMMSLGHFPQAFKIIKNRSAKNISILTYTIFAIGTMLWVVYGVYIKSLVIIISFLPGVVGSWLILFLIFKFRKNS